MTDETNGSGFASRSTESEVSPENSLTVIYFRMNHPISWKDPSYEAVARIRGEQLLSNCVWAGTEVTRLIREHELGMLRCRDGKMRPDPGFYDSMKIVFRSCLLVAFHKYRGVLANLSDANLDKLELDDALFDRFLIHIGFDFERATMIDHYHHFTPSPVVVRERLEEQELDQAEINARWSHYRKRAEFGGRRARQHK